TLQEHHTLTDLRKVRQQGLLVLAEDLGAGGHADDEVGRCGAGHVLALAVLAAPGLEMLGVAEVDEGAEAVDRLEHDIPAASAVAAVGAAKLDELLAPERH